MSKKNKLKKQLNDFVGNGVVSNNVELIIQNAIQRLDDKRFDVEEAKKYILDWVLTLKDKGYCFSEYESRLYEIVKPEPYKPNVSNGIAWSIISIFR